MMDNYCVNCKHYDGVFACTKEGDAVSPVYGRRIYAYRKADASNGLDAKTAEEVRTSYCKGDWFEPSRWARFKELVDRLLGIDLDSKRGEDDSSPADVLEKPGTTSVNALAIEILRVLNNGVEDDEKSGQITFCFRDGEWLAQVFSPYLAEMVTVDHTDSIEEAGKELLELCKMLMEAKK